MEFINLRVLTGRKNNLNVFKSLGERHSRDCFWDIFLKETEKKGGRGRERIINVDLWGETTMNREFLHEPTDGVGNFLTALSPWHWIGSGSSVNAFTQLTFVHVPRLTRVSGVAFLVGVTNWPITLTSGPRPETIGTYWGWAAACATKEMTKTSPTPCSNSPAQTPPRMSFWRLDTLGWPTVKGRHWQLPWWLHDKWPLLPAPVTRFFGSKNIYICSEIRKCTALLLHLYFLI